jgi:hypothetical protein
VIETIQFSFKYEYSVEYFAEKMGLKNIFADISIFSYRSEGRIATGRKHEMYKNGFSAVHREK